MSEKRLEEILEALAIPESDSLPRGIGTVMAFDT